MPHVLFPRRSGILSQNPFMASATANPTQFTTIVIVIIIAVVIVISGRGDGTGDEEEEGEHAVRRPNTVPLNATHHR